MHINELGSKIIVSADIPSPEIITQHVRDVRRGICGDIYIERSSINSSKIKCKSKDSVAHARLL